MSLAGNTNGACPALVGDTMERESRRNGVSGFPAEPSIRLEEWNRYLSKSILLASRRNFALPRDFRLRVHGGKRMLSRARSLSHFHHRSARRFRQGIVERCFGLLSQTFFPLDLIVKNARNGIA